MFSLTHSQAIEQKHIHCNWTKDDTSQPIDFEGDAIILELPDKEGDWKIIPKTNPQVRKLIHSEFRQQLRNDMFMVPVQIEKVDVQLFQVGQQIPSCSVLLQWTGSEDVQPLFCKVKIKGAKGDNNFFYLNYSPEKGECTLNI